MTPHDDEHLWAGDWTSRPVPEEPPTRPAEPATAVHAPPAAPVAQRRRAPWVAAGAAGTAAIVAVILAAGVPSSALPAAAARSPAAGGTVAAVYDKAAPAVVSIKSNGGQGTGFLIDKDGTIVTNDHVVGTAQTVQVQFGEDGAPVTGRVLGADASTDLAVVKIDAAAAAGVTPLQLADDRTVQAGDLVVAIGNPFGLDRTVTSGVVSATDREIQAPNGFSIGDAIQTDAAINPGNSGGPLLDAAGKVIGVNSQIATASGGGGNVGIGFAVPSRTVQQIVPQLKSGGTVAHPYLGVSTGDTRTGTGAQVGSVQPGSPAARAGIQQGDTIVEVDGRAVTGADAVSAAVAGHRPGDSVAVTIERNGQRQSLQVQLGTRPDEAP